MLEKSGDWYESTLRPLFEQTTDSPAFKEVLARNPKVVLLSADVDRIQEYVFESARLPEIRGASMLIDELNRRAAAILGEMRVIYEGGGSLLAILPDLEIARQVQAEIERLFPEQTGLATVTCVIYEATVQALLDGYVASKTTPADIWAVRDPKYRADWERITAAYNQGLQVDQVPFEDSVRVQAGFGQMVEFMSLLLRRKKEQGRALVFHETLPHAQRCRSCGRRPAAEMYQYAEGELWPLCRPCQLKIEGRSGRRSFWIEEVEEAKAAFSAPEYLAGISAPVDIANDLTEIGQACWPRKGYIGFIYADGDGIGQFMTGQQTPGQYKEASQQLKQATREAVYQALGHFLKPSWVKRKSDRNGSEEAVIIHPFEIITIGGDDVLLIVPAHVALPIAIDISQGFARKLKGYNLTMSAGVVIAPDHNPVRSLRDIAGQLGKSAKRRARETRSATGKAAQAEPNGGLDFLVLTSQSMLRRELSELRQTYPIRLPGEGQSSRLRLTGAPYTLTEASKLLNLLYLMRRGNFPGSQLQQLVAALRQGREYGSLFFLYQQARLRGRPQGAILGRLEQGWPFDPQTDPIPWQMVRQEPPDPDPEVGYTSILPDLADLFSFVPAEEELLQPWHKLIEEKADANSD